MAVPTSTIPAASDNERQTLKKIALATSGNAGDYETVAASQTAQKLGATGGVGDVLGTLVIVPATTAAGNVSIKDGNGSAISVFATGTLADLTPIVLPLNLKAAVSTTPGWSVTTGANVSVIASGNFT